MRPQCGLRLLARAVVSWHLPVPQRVAGWGAAGPAVAGGRGELGQAQHPRVEDVPAEKARVVIQQPPLPGAPVA